MYRKMAYGFFTDFVRILRILFSLRQKKYGIEGEGILFTDFLRI